MEGGRKTLTEYNDAGWSKLRIEQTNPRSVRRKEGNQDSGWLSKPSGSISGGRKRESGPVSIIDGLKKKEHK